MMKKIILTILMIFISIFIVACGAGGGDSSSGGSSPVPATPVTTISGNIYSISSSFISSSQAPSGYSNVDGTITFTYNNGSPRSATISNGYYSIPIYDADYVVAGVGNGPLTGEIVISTASFSAKGEIDSIKKTSTSNNFEIRVTSTGLNNNSIVVIDQSETTVAKDFNLTMYYYSNGNMVPLNNASCLLMESGNGFSYKGAQKNIKLTSSEANNIISNKVNLFVKASTIYARKTITASDNSLVIIECGDEDMILPYFTSTNRNTILNAFKDIASKDYLSASSKLSLIVSEEIEKPYIALAKGLIAMKQRDYSKAITELSTYKSSFLLSAMTYAASRIVSSKTISDFTEVYGILDNIGLSNELYFSDGYCMGINNSQVHSIYAMGLMFSGKGNLASSRIDYLNKLYSRDSSLRWDNSIPDKIQRIANQI